MFTKARLKFTLFYSVLFLFLFWLFSLGLYIWMERSVGEGYLSQVKERHEQGLFQGDAEDFDDRSAAIVTVAGDVAVGKLGEILLFLNIIFLVVIPVISWILAKKTLAPIEKAHEQQKQFVSDASHELRTPLTIISGEMEVALTKNRPSQEYRKVLQSSKEETGRLTSLVENLLFLSREDQGKTPGVTEKVDIVDVVSDAIAELKQSIEKKKLKISFKPPQESIAVIGNTSMLKQLFFNLVENAVKYTPPGGKIWVSFVPKRQYVNVDIRDVGIGIDIKKQKKIFDRFYRVDPARSSVKGYGLGLAISSAIIKWHKGDISVKSALGKGTIFSVRLPYRH